MSNHSEHHMTCDRFADLVGPAIDGELDAATAAALDAHAAGCPECATLRAELEEIRAQAAELPLLVPSRDLWDGIASRIEPKVIPLAERSAAARPPAPRRWLRPALAAAALVGVTAGLTYQMTKRALQPAASQVAVVPTDTNPGVVVGGSTVDTLRTLDTVYVNRQTTVASNDPKKPGASGSSTGERRSEGPKGARPGTKNPTGERRQPDVADRQLAGNATLPAAARQVEQVYGGEISRLRTIVSQRRAELDPATIDVIEKNLTIIDSAIVQSRRAIRRDPASGFLLEQLNSAYDKKVELLRTAAMLPARS